MSKERIDYLDAIKGVSIILVVFCHYVLLSNATVVGNIVMSIASGAVPCFFMVTGGIMHRAPELNWKKHMLKIGKVYSTLCIWKFIYLIMFSCVYEVTFSKTGLLQYLFLFGSIENVNTGHMWFMYAYLAALLFYPVTHFLFHGGKEGRKILVFVLALQVVSGMLISAVNFGFEILSKGIGCGLMVIEGLRQILVFGNYSNMLAYFILGAFLLKNRDVWKNYAKQKWYLKYIPGALTMLGTVGLLLIKAYSVGNFRWGGELFDQWL